MNEGKIKYILNENGLEHPSPQFTNRLTHLVVHSYKRNYQAVYKKDERLGKVILVILVGSNLLMLYLLNPFSLQPMVLLYMSVFVLATWGSIGLVKKMKYLR